MNKKMIPLYLTFCRMVLVVPVLVLLSWGEGGIWYLLAAFLWLLAGITDGLDGYLSRRWKVQSTAGALLDPAADKILTLSVLVFLSYLGKVDPLLVVLFMARDIYVTTLRSIAADKGLILYARPLAKWKTTLQIVGVLFVLVAGGGAGLWLYNLGYFLLWVCVVMSGVSAWEYTKDFTKKFKFVDFQT